MNGVPASAGASLVPLRSGKWQGEQLASYCWWPAVACAEVKGPGAPWPKATVPSAAASAKPAPASKRVLLRIIVLIILSALGRVVLGQEPVILLGHIGAHRLMGGQQPTP